jgi:hypothetical protein
MGGKMKISKGFIFRWGMRIKDFGERLRHIRIFDIRVFGWCWRSIRNLGYAIRDTTNGCSVKEM